MYSPPAKKLVIELIAKANVPKLKIMSIEVKIIPVLETQWEVADAPVLQKRIEELIHDIQFDDLLTDFGKTTLKDRYLLPSENSPQEAFFRAAKAFSDNDEMAQRIYDYSSKLWFMYSTPILSNGGT